MFSDKFNADYEWYLFVSDKFDFDGNSSYHNKKGIPLIQHDENGVTAKEAFYSWDTFGKILKTSQPDELLKILRTKGSVNLHVKMYAEDRAKGVLPKVLFKEILEELKAPAWFEEAVENQKPKHYTPELKLLFNKYQIPENI